MKLDKSALLAHIRSLQRELDGLMDIVIAWDETQPEQITPVQTTEQDDWMTAKQTCKCLKISETTFYEYVKAGLLPPGFAFGPKSKRWRMSDILSWQNSKQNDANEHPKIITKRRGRVSSIRKIGEFCHA